MRKFVVASIAVVAVGIAFFVYVSLMDTAPMVQPNTDQTPDIDLARNNQRATGKSAMLI